MGNDHYATLGVDPGARHTDIRAAYRALMREYHPDLRPGDPSAEEMSRRITAAWAVVGRPSRRAAYDRARAAGRPLPPLAKRTQSDGPAAYSPIGADYRRAFHRASLRVGAIVFALGLVVLLTLSR